MFWVFGFPLILALALGFAFREKPPDRVPVGVVAGPHAQQRLAALQKSPVLLPRIMSEQEARDALRRGKVSLLIEGDATPSSIASIRRVPTRARARVEADDALQTAAGRRDVFAAREERVHEQGARYIDFLDPRSPRHEPDGHRHVEHGLHHRQRAHEEAAQAPRGHADAQDRLPARAVSLAADLAS